MRKNEMKWNSKERKNMKMEKCWKSLAELEFVGGLWMFLLSLDRGWQLGARNKEEWQLEEN